MLDTTGTLLVFGSGRFLDINHFGMNIGSRMARHARHRTPACVIKSAVGSTLIKTIGSPIKNVSKRLAIDKARYLEQAEIDEMRSNTKLHAESESTFRKTYRDSLNSDGRCRPR